MLALAFLSAESGRNVGQDAYGVRERGRGRKGKGEEQTGEDEREERRRGEGRGQALGGRTNTIQSNPSKRNHKNISQRFTRGFQYFFPVCFRINHSVR